VKAATKAEKKAARIAAKQRKLCASGEPQVIGHPAGCKGKGIPKPMPKPVMRMSIVPRH
jgi:hypothetical protein